MKANELRIGNLIYEHWFTPNENAVKIVDTDVLVNIQLPKLPTDLGEYRPIQLTEEMLLKNNTIKNENGNFLVYKRFRLIWRNEYKYWYVVCNHSLTYITKIEFVHEWQNFLYIINGEELNFNIQ